ncbi:hypothetical protein C5188_11650 [Serratia liquefaciens]|uniref:hypothetical protein n=1 Tax=Serratia liquefaciens TaxID=614 RepID=UPI000D5142A5|nr:hypothetical protein [Serratia liquefaciens]PVD45049.1 hypothetical protein C5188_11650 [Serratia liquefaciens]QHT50275.1 hypothetical protein C5686_008030 [Serratia liquefaciens]CAI1150670.1 Uncharacterised protein [Serratia liquefaciens]CAI1563505.1 Uncharacterised protein [Serratia liquefaciens]CAI2037230.1 Uncharacterised protein [Serratia liquefaciens]
MTTAIKNVAFTPEVTHESFYLKLLRWLIALFIIASPLSPFVANTTLYLWIPLVFLDFEYIRTFKKIPKAVLLCIFIWLSLCFLFFRYDLAIKSFVLILGVSYLVKIGNPITNKVYVCMLISIIWCVIQFIAYQVSPSYSAAIGPGSISKFFWGEFATMTYTNQYTLFLFPRMSGLSREAGFFASLLIISFMIRYRDNKLGLIEKSLFLLGYLFSLSKSSITLVLFFILHPMRNLLRKVPVIIAFIGFIVIFVSLAQFLNIGSPNYFTVNESIAHRLSASYLMLHMNIGNLLYGCNTEYNCIVDYQPVIKYLTDQGMVPAVGLSGLIMDMGLLGFVGVIFSFVVLKLDSYDVAILAMFTATVSFFTVDSFIILTYFYILTNHKNKVIE